MYHMKYYGTVLDYLTNVAYIFTNHKTKHKKVRRTTKTAHITIQTLVTKEKKSK